jgi:capsular exopolysaccharide synthesis family protein
VRYYRVLREHLWLVALCTVLALVAAIVYVEAAPRRYKAEAELVVTPAQSNNAVLNQLPVQQSTGDPTTDILTASALVTTNEVATAVIRSLRLTHTSPAAVLSNVQATPVGQSSLVAVQAEASSPTRAQRLANAFVRERIATSTTVMHRALAVDIPGLQASVAKIPAAEQGTPGGLGELLDEYQSLLTRPDPTLGIAQLATLPTAPYTPKTKLSLAAGLLAGLLLGVGAAFGFNALDPRLRREEQLRSLHGAPILARIPREPVRKTRRPLLPAELSFVSHEGYRRLRTTLASRRSDGVARAFLVTGSSPSEGKTTTAISLAFALAQGGVRVILIEADLRRPTIAGALKLKPAFGTAEVMTGEVELADALRTVTIDDTTLRVLAAARAGDDLADSLSNTVARDLIADAKELADFVVIDSPPLTAVVDALPLAQFADEVLVVARLGQSRLGKLADLDELLGQQGASITGLVVVGEAPTRGSSYYYAGGEEAVVPRERGKGPRAGSERAGSERAGSERAGSERSGSERSETKRAGPERAGRSGAGSTRT